VLFARSAELRQLDRLQRRRRKKMATGKTPDEAAAALTVDDLALQTARAELDTAEAAVAAAVTRETAIRPWKTWVSRSWETVHSRPPVLPALPALAGGGAAGSTLLGRMISGATPILIAIAWAAIIIYFILVHWFSS